MTHLGKSPDDMWADWTAEIEAKAVAAYRAELAAKVRNLALPTVPDTYYWRQVETARDETLDAVLALIEGGDEP